MRKIELMPDEQNKYQVIKQLVDNNGNKKRAAIQLNCTIRTINRLIHVYKEKGKAGFVHGNRGKAPACKIDDCIKQQVIDMYKDEYLDTNFIHFSEIVESDLGIKIAPNTISRWLKEEEFIISPKARRKTKRAMRKKLKDLQSGTLSVKEKNKVIIAEDILECTETHQRRPRCKYEGEMIQMDASSYEWVPGEVWHLHVAIDDASGKITGAYFDTQETLKGYYQVLKQILTNYGIPYMFYTDRRTVFEYKRKNTLLDEDDTFTQFSYACKTLGIQIKTTSVAPAKGRVERLNQTLQSRLPVELRRSSIKTIEQANEFLSHYVESFNKRFALQLDSSKNVYETQPTNEMINQTLAVISHRKIDSGNSIKFMYKYYLPTNEYGEVVHFPKKTECLMIKCLDGSLYVSINDKLYIPHQVLEHERLSKAFDQEVPTTKEKKKYKPPMNHPWRMQSFKKHANAQSHRALI